MVVEQRRLRTPPKLSSAQSKQTGVREFEVNTATSDDQGEEYGRDEEAEHSREEWYRWTRHTIKCETTSKDKPGARRNLDGRAEQEPYRIADTILEQETQVGFCQAVVRLDAALL